MKIKTNIPNKKQKSGEHMIVFELIKCLFPIAIFGASIISAVLGIFTFFLNDYRFVYIGAILYMYQIVMAFISMIKKKEIPTAYSTLIIVVIFASGSYFFKIDIIAGICLGLCVESLGLFIMQFRKLVLKVKNKNKK